MAQSFELSDYQWQNRLLLVVVNDPDQPDYQQQLEAFRQCTEGLAERQLLIFQILPETFCLGINENAAWKKGAALYQKHRSENHDFSVSLIGLDGRVKMREHSPTTCSYLFSLIDQMPMRRAEMKRKGG